MKNENFHVHVLPSGRYVKAKPDRSLMESLMSQNIFLRSDCGGKGVCKKCRVEIVSKEGDSQLKEACQLMVTKDISINIPEISMLSSHIISKAPTLLPSIFKKMSQGVDKEESFGIAVDLGTTTIAIYLCNTARGEVISSLAVKNPQVLYGDDVISRIGSIGQKEKNLGQLQKLVVRAIEWGIDELLASHDFVEDFVSKMVAVGNPTMIHILLGVDPKPIGVSPYQPAFYEARNVQSDELGFKLKNFSIQVLPQVSGFIGGDIISAAVAVDLENKPDGTLLVDLGTNGELILKANGSFFATSCATGPAFEGASLSCGMQAVPGAVNKVLIKSGKNLPEYTCINPFKSSKISPSGVCGTGIISTVAQLCQKNFLEPGGAFKNELILSVLRKDDSGKLQYIIVPEKASQSGSAIFISQKDIRSVQLGKAALITGIEFLLKKAGIEKPDAIIVAGAFGTFLDKKDMMTLGMIPSIDPGRVKMVGNAAGTGSIMALCNDIYLKKSIQIAEKINIVDLACNQSFQDKFIKNLRFPISR